MTQLEHVIQVAIVGGAVAGVLFMFAAQAIADRLSGALRVVAVDTETDGDGWDWDEPDRQSDDFDWDEPVDPDSAEPDDTDEWDRARDRWLDEQAGAA